MKFKDPSEVESICWQLKQADYPRGANRARINDLFNGVPPFTPEEVKENSVEVNVNFLEATRLSHDARSQFSNAFTKPGNYFTARTDMGPQSKRAKNGATVTRRVNRLMKRSLSYYEHQRSKFALNVLHGVGPGVWEDSDLWCPSPIGIEDVLVPGNTLLTMKNLPFFALYRTFSAPELIKLTRGPNVDPGWQMDYVKACIENIDRESLALMGTNWPDIWSPEKMAERLKSDGGFYMGDNIPTINCYDFYFLDLDTEDPGWRRRIIVDAWSSPESPDWRRFRKGGELFKRGGFLYDGGDRKFANCWRNMLSFQFADLSACAPFRYHSVRSLGFLLYAVCHLQNLLRCRFNEAVFESLLMYFRVKTMDDVQRALKVELINRGFIEDGISPLNANERYQVNAQLVQLGLLQNAQIINENTSSYVQQPNYSQGGVEKTKFQVMAETNAMTTLISSALNQAYQYQTFEYFEILRRFFKVNSKDPEVRDFQAGCIKDGVPEKLMDVDYWDIEPERIMGAGNKTLEMTIAQQLMEWRALFDPEPQRAILRDAVLAITDDPSRASSLVPENPVQISDSVHDAQVSAAALMLGLPVSLKTGMNHIEYVDTLIRILAGQIMQGKQNGNMVKPETLQGLQNIIGSIMEHVAIVAQDPGEKQRVKDWMEVITRAQNELRGFQQRLFEQAKKAAETNGGGGADPEVMAKIQAQQAETQAKIQNMRESHANRTAQRQVQFEMEEKRRAQEHALDMQRKQAELQADIAAKDLQTEAEINLSEKKARTETKTKTEAKE